MWLLAGRVGLDYTSGSSSSVAPGERTSSGAAGGAAVCKSLDWWTTQEADNRSLLSSGEA